MSGTISETILCERSDTCDCELHQVIRERDVWKSAAELWKDRHYARECQWHDARLALRKTERERDKAQIQLTDIEKTLGDWMELAEDRQAALEEALHERDRLERSLAQMAAELSAIKSYATYTGRYGEEGAIVEVSITKLDRLRHKRDEALQNARVSEIGRLQAIAEANRARSDRDEARAADAATIDALGRMTERCYAAERERDALRQALQRIADRDVEWHNVALEAAARLMRETGDLAYSEAELNAAARYAREALEEEG